MRLRLAFTRPPLNGAAAGRWLRRTVRQAATMASNNDLVFVFMPSLVATLLNRERAKGSALTEAEVLAIRDGAQVVASPPDVALKVEEGRGYKDIDPERCWEEWQQARVNFIEDGPAKD